MNLRSKAATYGIAALVLAALVIFSGATLGVINPSSSGILSVLLTDPPSVPDGVSSVYITYSGLALHAAGLGDGGWLATGGQGTLDTLGLVNLSQTVSTGSVPALMYNAIAFNISSVKVEYLGRNYTATVNGGKVVVPIVGGLTVNSTHPAATLVDIQPTVLNLANQTNPDFVITAGGRALQVPFGEVTESMRHLGYRLSLAERGWFRAFAASHLEGVALTGARLTTNSLSLSVANLGPDPVTIRMVIISLSSPGSRPVGVLASLANSFVFAVKSNGSLLPLRMGTTDQFQAVLRNTGYQLVGSASANFSYLGAITTLISRNGISSGTSYYVVLVGSHTLTYQTVKAA